MKIEEKLDQLYFLQEQIGKINSHFEELKSEVLTPEIQQKLKDIDAAKTTAINELQGTIDAYTSEIKSDVLLIKSTVHGQFTMAVWNKGRISWDSKGLAGYEVAHPEIAAFKSVGEPSVTIRKA